MRRKKRSTALIALSMIACQSDCPVVELETDGGSAASSAAAETEADVLDLPGALDVAQIETIVPLGWWHLPLWAYPATLPLSASSDVLWFTRSIAFEQGGAVRIEVMGGEIQGGIWEQVMEEQCEPGGRVGYRWYVVDGELRLESDEFPLAGSEADYARVNVSPDCDAITFSYFKGEEELSSHPEYSAGRICADCDPEDVPNYVKVVLDLCEGEAPPQCVLSK